MKVKYTRFNSSFVKTKYLYTAEGTGQRAFFCGRKWKKVMSITVAIGYVCKLNEMIFDKRELVVEEVQL